MVTIRHLGIIGGTALEALPLKNRVKRAIKTPWGKPSGVVHCGAIGENEVFFINRHGDDHRIPPHRVNYRANIAALQQLGVDGIVAVNAVGGINAAMPPGALVLPNQLIDYTWGRIQTYSHGADDVLRHVDFSLPYCGALQQKLQAAARARNIALMVGGVHGVTQGPRLETAAEIVRMERDGCDLVGMTGMPEAALARELGIAYVCIALVVNPAAGKSEREITLAEIAAVMASTAPELLALLTEFCQ
ncbi:MAG: S-methyl-5'-thioinosine phosphorylase [Porticoccaceae bacterium]|nr:S-methyl-5'-thioinosine phosphorylase [Porticoccaceae bacterium]